MDIFLKPFLKMTDPPVYLLLLLITLFLVKDSESLAGNSFYQPDGGVAIGQYGFDTMQDYLHSDYFRSNNMRCGSQKPEKSIFDDAMLRSIEDCTFSLTNLQDEYWPSVTYIIQVWWHVIYRSDGVGNIDDVTIQEQIGVLNEDFRAASGSGGFDVKIEFELAGITRTMNDEWFSDSDDDEGEYKAVLGRNQEKYLNIYSNDARGYLGYATFPQLTAGQTLDGIVIFWQAAGGRDNGFSIYDQGRTLVHEVGHYLGLFHTFEDGASCGNGYTSGDLIADTNAEQIPHYDCVQENSCGDADPIHNYMSYTNDTCMSEFTREQANRTVCSLVNYRPQLFDSSTIDGPAPEFPWPLFLQIYTREKAAEASSIR